MYKFLGVFALLGMSLLTGCGTINQTLQSMECNREAIDQSTYVINENARAIEEANRSIEENRRQLEEINKALKKASAS